MKRLKYVVWIILLIALTTSVITTYVLLQRGDTLKQDIKNEIDSKLENIPVPKDGKDATPEQIEQAVANYLVRNPVENGQNGKDGKSATDQQVQQAVGNYMASNPIKNGVDGTNGKDGQDGSSGADGKTPQIQCDTIKNRWEVRYSDDENWQLLNGQSVKCTIGTE